MMVATPESTGVESEAIDGAKKVWDLGAEEFRLDRHNGCVTIHNPMTGQHRTFLIETNTSDDEFFQGKRIVSLLVGPDNSNDYVSFGFVDETGHVRVWKRHRGMNGRRSDFEKFANLLTFPTLFARRGLEYVCEGRCRKCNRRLTTRESVQTGLGPVCRGK